MSPADLLSSKAKPAHFAGDRHMTGMLMEAVVLSFTIGGIVGAIGALHLKHAAPVQEKTEEQHKSY